MDKIDFVKQTNFKDDSQPFIVVNEHVHLQTLIISWPTMEI